MDNTENTRLPAPSATVNAGVSDAPITPPSHLSGADACRYVLEEAKRRRILREREAEQRLRAERDAEKTKREQTRAELDRLREANTPKPEPTSEPEQNPALAETDPTLINPEDF